MEKKKKSGLWAEFKEFISRGNVMDLAVGVIIGSAFTAIVNSLVNDMLMPVIGLISGGIDFSGLKLVLTPAVGDTPEVALCYGSFLQSILNFLLVALALFLLVKALNAFRRKKEEAPAPAPEPPQALGRGAAAHTDPGSAAKITLKKQGLEGYASSGRCFFLGI